MDGGEPVGSADVRAWWERATDKRVYVSPAGGPRTSVISTLNGKGHSPGQGTRGTQLEKGSVQEQVFLAGLADSMVYASIGVQVGRGASMSNSGVNI